MGEYAWTIPPRPLLLDPRSLLRRQLVPFIFKRPYSTLPGCASRVHRESLLEGRSCGPSDIGLHSGIRTTHGRVLGVDVLLAVYSSDRILLRLRSSIRCEGNIYHKFLKFSRQCRLVHVFLFLGNGLALLKTVATEIEWILIAFQVGARFQCPTAQTESFSLAYIRWISLNPRCRISLTFLAL